MYSSETATAAEDSVEVVVIYGNQHILSGLTAVENFQRQTKKNVKTIVLYRQNWINLEKFNSFADLSREIIDEYRAELLIVTEANWQQNSGDMNKLLGLDERNTKVERIYFPHNLVSDTLDVMRSEFPKSKMVCFGDGLGIVFSKLSFKAAKGNSKLSKIYRILNKIEILHQLKFIDQYVLILPINHSGSRKILENTVIPKKDKVLKLIHALCGSIKVEMVKFIHEYLDSNSVVICLENFSATGTITLEREISLFIEIIKLHENEGKNIYIKRHPMQEDSKFNQIKDGLEDFYLQELPNFLDEIPIELWPLSHFRGRIYAVGTVALSLTYLYGIQVTNPLNDRLIEKYFAPEYWSLIKNDLDLMTKPLRGLGNWDGTSILYQHG